MAEQLLLKEQLNRTLDQAQRDRKKVLNQRRQLRHLNNKVRFMTFQLLYNQHVTEYESKSRWIPLDETSPSECTLFYCKVCGRVSKTPDKSCRTGRAPNEPLKCSKWPNGHVKDAAHAQPYVLDKSARLLAHFVWVQVQELKRQWKAVDEYPCEMGDDWREKELELDRFVMGIEHAMMQVSHGLADMVYQGGDRYGQALDPPLGTMVLSVLPTMDIDGCIEALEECQERCNALRRKFLDATSHGPNDEEAYEYGRLFSDMGAVSSALRRRRPLARPGQEPPKRDEPAPTLVPAEELVEGGSDPFPDETPTGDMLKRVDRLGLSPRVERVLARAGLVYVGDLLTKGRVGLFGLNGFGRHALKEVEGAMRLLTPNVKLPHDPDEEDDNWAEFWAAKRPKE